MHLNQEDEGGVLNDENGTAVKGTVLVLRIIRGSHDRNWSVADSLTRSGSISKIQSSAYWNMVSMNVTNAMKMSIRMKASDDPIDLRAMEEAGGRYVDIKYPKFEFPSEAHQMKYNRIRKELRGGEGSSES